MNGGNCSSFCPVSRRRQKPLLPRQTMPLCGRQRPAAHTSPALCEPPIATPGPGAAASGTLSRGDPRWLPRRAGQGCKGLLAHGPRVYIHMASRVLGAGGLLWPEVWRGRQRLPSLPASRQGREGSINNSHTPETSWGGGGEARVLEPARGRGGWGWIWKSQSLPPHPRGFGLQSGGTDSALNLGCARPGLASACSDKGQRLGCVYMMHSSLERQAPGRLPCSSSRKEGGGPRGQMGDTEELGEVVSLGCPHPGWWGHAGYPPHSLAFRPPRPPSCPS